MTQASKLPWRADGSEMSLATWVYDANQKRVCTMARCETDWGNAEFIVTACNSHTALTERVAKLEAALQGLVNAASDRGVPPNRHRYVTSGLGPHFEAAVVALAKP